VSARSVNAVFNINWNNLRPNYSLDLRYYDAYLNYFSEFLRDHTPNEAFERFVLSSSSNFNPGLPAKDVKDVKSAGDEGKKHPEMLNRLLAGLLHPFIHFGYGFEFGLPGQVAEGLCTVSPSICDPILKDTRPCLYCRT
jgi:Questin oxidase-like